MLGRLSAQQIDEVLKANTLGRIGCNDGNRNYVVPVNYVYDGMYIIGHSVAGMKIDMMRKNPAVCFEVDEMNSFTNWKSVILWGQYQELKSERERLAAMKLFVDRMMYMKLSETAIPPETTGTRVHPRAPGYIKLIVYRIAISEKTGRFEKD